MWTPPWSMPDDDEPPLVRPVWTSCPRRHGGAIRRRRDNAIWCPTCDLMYLQSFQSVIDRIVTRDEAA